MKARIKFTKTGTMKFLGHLDVMRHFQKVFRRSGLDVAYSKGFNPHPILSFASPLGVGLTSEGEYLDLELDSLGNRSMEDWIRHMNGETNEEIQIIDFIPLKDTAKPSMSLLAAADYAVYVKEGYQVCDDVERKVVEFLSKDFITIIKKTKKNEKEIDLKEYVYDIMDNNVENESIISLFTVRLAAGSVMNLKPELILEAFCMEYGFEYQPFAYQIHRKEMYADVNAAKGEIHSNHNREFRQLVPLSMIDGIEND